MHLFTYLFIYLFIYLSIYVFIYLIIYLFIISFKLLKLRWIYSAKRESFREVDRKFTPGCCEMANACTYL